MKKWFCDKCKKEVNIDQDGFAQMKVYWWHKGANGDRMEYKPDYRHREGYEEFMMCAECANEVFGQLDGMEKA